MQKLIKYIFTLTIIVNVVACSSKKDAEAKLNDEKIKLEKLKSENSKNAAEIKKLQEDIAKADTANGKKRKAKLVATTPVASQNFNHYIDLQGVVNAENTSYISPRGMPGQVRAIYVKEGQYISKGQLVLKLDNAIIGQQVQGANQQAIAAKQQLEGLRTQLAFAKNILVRQQNLWNQGIGTEVQLLTAKTNVQALENQLGASAEQVKAVYEQVKVAKEQMNTANVYSDVSGVIEDLNIRVGETFTGMGMMGAQIKVVNTSSLKVVTTISENYIGRIRKGSLAEVTLPDYNLTYNSSVTLLSQTIDQNRGFTAEIKLPADPRLKPNQTAKVRILDYAAPNAIVIPINVVQSDEVSKYVYVLQAMGSGRAIAKKVIVNIGEVYGDKVEIKTGLLGGEQLITEGYLSIYEGQSITTTIN